MPGSAHIKSALKSQYQAALAMFRSAVEKCTKELWLDGGFPNPTWRVAYHTVYFYHLYLHQNLRDYSPLPGHREGAQNMPSDPDGGEMKAYSKVEILSLIDHLISITGDAVDKLDIEAEGSGFPWYQVNKCEHQLVNLRHLQHHIAQLQDRIRNRQNAGISWVRAGT